MPGSIGCHHACLVQSVHEKSLTRYLYQNIWHPSCLGKGEISMSLVKLSFSKSIDSESFLEKGPTSKLFLGWQCATDLDPKTCWVKTSPGVEGGLEHWQLSGWKCKQEANHFAVTVSNISITHFAVWETNFTTDCQNNLLRHHSTRSFGQANWSASVKQLCNKDDLERFSAKKTASLLRASFSNQISKNCLCYPSIFRTGFLRRLVHVGLRS